MKVPFLDLRVTDDAERRELTDALDAVLRHGRFVFGPEVGELEGRLAAACGRRFAVGVGSGTDALIVGLKSLGIGPGDEVITTPLSFVATANAISLVGAVPVFADVGDDLNLDPDTIDPLVTAATKAVLPVHWTGRVCRMSDIMAVAERRKLMVVEDCSQAFGATRNGAPAGSFGAVACFSMNPMKVFAACGEAGFVATDCEDAAEALRTLHYNGMVDRDTCSQISHNARLDTVQAAMLLRRIERYPAKVVARRDVARFYDQALSGVVETPPADDGGESVYYTYTVLASDRDRLRAHLAENGIETKVQHLPLMPDQPAHRPSAGGDCPNARRLMKNALSLPASEKVSADQRQYVADCIRAFYG